MWHKLRQEVLIELLSIEERRAEKLPDTHSHRHTLTYRQNTSGLILFSVISQENIHKSQSLNPNTDMLFVCVCACLRVHAALSVHACVCVCIELHLSAWNRGSDKTFLLFSLTYSTER